MKKELEKRMQSLFYEIGNLNPTDKQDLVNTLDKLSAALIRPAALLDRQDLENICYNAAQEWCDVVLTKRLGGESLSPRDVQAIMWLKGVILCLRRHGLLQQPVDIDWDI